MKFIKIPLPGLAAFKHMTAWVIQQSEHLPYSAVTQALEHHTHILELSCMSQCHLYPSCNLEKKKLSNELCTKKQTNRPIKNYLLLLWSSWYSRSIIKWQLSTDVNRWFTTDNHYENIRTRYFAAIDTITKMSEVAFSNWIILPVPHMPWLNSLPWRRRAQSLRDFKQGIQECESKWLINIWSKHDDQIVGRIHLMKW